MKEMVSSIMQLFSYQGAGIANKLELVWNVPCCKCDSTASGGIVVKARSNNTICIIRFFLYHYTKTKEIIHESVNLKGVVYN